MLTRWWNSKKEELKENKNKLPLQTVRLLPLEWGKVPAFAELTWVKITEMKSFPQARFSADGSSGFSLSLSSSFSSIPTTTSLHVFQVGRQDSMNLMPLHRPSRFGPRSNRCKHEFQRVRRLSTIGELTILEQRTKTITILLAPKAAAFSDRGQQ